MVRRASLELLLLPVAVVVLAVAVAVDSIGAPASDTLMAVLCAGAAALAAVDGIRRL